MRNETGSKRKSLILKFLHFSIYFLIPGTANLGLLLLKEGKGGEGGEGRGGKGREGKNCWPQNSELGQMYDLFKGINSLNLFVLFCLALRHA